MRILVAFVLKLLEPFIDDRGRLSSMRIMTMMTVAASIYLFMEVITVWKVVCIEKKEFIPLNFTDFTGLLGAVAALFAKGWQKNIEIKGDECLSESDTAPSTQRDSFPRPPESSKTDGPRRRPAGVPAPGEGE